MTIGLAEDKHPVISKYFYIIGGLMCLCLILVVIPLHFWESFLLVFSGKEHDLYPFHDYIFRASIFGYFVWGLFFFVIARDPERYKPLIRISLLGLVLNSIACFYVGIESGVSPVLFLFDTLMFLIAAIILGYILYFKKL